MEKTNHRSPNRMDGWSSMNIRMKRHDMNPRSRHALDESPRTRPTHAETLKRLFVNWSLLPDRALMSIGLDHIYMGRFWFKQSFFARGGRPIVKSY